ncbi:MAG: peptidoglycan-binding protein [Eubacteriales bacterium]|nr:peptidoglycan-binding protein [Eubacteriales bacterium]
MERRRRKKRSNEKRRIKIINSVGRIVRGVVSGIALRFLTLSRRMRLLILGSLGVVLAAAVLAIVMMGGANAEAEQVSVAEIPVPTYTEVPTSTPTPTTIPTTEPEPTRDVTMEYGDESKDVQELQERLMTLGYLDIDETTEYYGPATKYAVELFQRQHDLEQDGIAGEETLVMIYSDDAKKYTLLEGTRGTDVDSLQRQLVALGYLDNATGYYGTDTVAAVKAFQERNSLDVDGKTGQYTLDLIYSPDAKASPDMEQAVRRSANINKMLEVAAAQLGKPYILGNEGPNSFDCSGLVYYCLKQAGSNRGRYNAAGYAKVSDWEEIKSMNNLEKGDLLFFWNKAHTKVGHVGIYIGGGMMIDASSSNGKVVKRSCNTSYWRSMFVRARRPW